MYKLLFSLALAVLIPVFSGNAAQFSEAERTEILSIHNDARKEVGSAPLAWSSKLAEGAEDWANNLKNKGCKLEHAPADVRKGGENLAGGYPFKASMAKLWVGEKANFNRSTEKCASGKVCGHYTQVVWHSTKEVGCAYAQCAKMGVMVCRYSPAGNYVGQSPFKK